VSGARSTEELVARLTDALEPVRPVPPLYRQVLAVAGIWAVSAAVVAGWLGLHPLAVLGRGGISTAVAVVLAWVGVAGLALGLASRIPGRERLALAAAGAVALGDLVVLAIGLGLRASADPGALGPRLNCIARSLLLAIPSALLALVLALRGAPWRPRVAGVGLALGATSLGALLVHLSCPSPSAWHWLVAHALVPLSAGVAVGLPVAWVLDRLGRRVRRLRSGVPLG
jgi:hypothetical protein